MRPLYLYPPPMNWPEPLHRVPDDAQSVPLADLPWPQQGTLSAGLAARDSSKDGRSRHNRGL